MLTWLKGKQPDPDFDRTSFTPEELGRAVQASFQTAASGQDFHVQVSAMGQAGIAPALAARVVNLIPIVAGWRFLTVGGPSPKLADHYTVVDEAGLQHDIAVAKYPVCLVIDAVLKQVDPATATVLALRSCEVVALNNLLNVRASVSEEDLTDLEIQAPQMGGPKLTFA